MRKPFQIIGWLEGTSLLALLFYAMPLKYGYGEPQMVRWIGSAHGALFMAYVALALVLFDRERWPIKKFGLAILLSSVPFGTWIFERKFLTSESKN